MPVTDNQLGIHSKVKATDRYRKFLEISSVFMKHPLTKVEIRLLDELYYISGGQITTESRKSVRENMDISAEQLNNYIRGLRKKGVIQDESVNPVFLKKLPEGSPFNINVQLQVVP